MNLGLKVGFEPASIENIKDVHPDFVEVWFDVRRSGQYNNLFDFLKENKTPAGLHFWGITKDGCEANITYPDKTLNQESFQLMQDTIDIAGRHNCIYVNIHLGTRTKITMDLYNEKANVLTEPADLQTCQETFVHNIGLLSQYAKDRNVILTIETIPQTIYSDWSKDPVLGRQNPIPSYPLPLSTYEPCIRSGAYVANDFGHTVALSITEDPNFAWDTLFETSKSLVQSTKLLHLGFIVPPYNGSDFHDQLDNPLMDTDKAIPNTKHMTELLKLFQNRNDVYALVEPQNDHPKNFRLASKILADAGVRPIQ